MIVMCEECEQVEADVILTADGRTGAWCYQCAKDLALDTSDDEDLGIGAW